MIVHLTPKQLQLTIDVLEEARAVSQQLTTQVPPSQKKKFVQQAVKIRKVLNKFNGATDDTDN